MQIGGMLPLGMPKETASCRGLGTTCAWLACPSAPQRSPGLAPASSLCSKHILEIQCFRHRELQLMLSEGRIQAFGSAFSSLPAIYACKPAASQFSSLWLFPLAEFPDVLECCCSSGIPDQ